VWNWGDGMTSVGQTPGPHNYTKACSCILKLTVTNAAGANTTGGLTIQVNP
jgi:PKD repeat protein